MEKVPLVQKDIIRRCLAMHRPVIVRITARPRFEQDMQTLKTLRNSIAIYGWAEGDVALGLPHKMVRLQTP